ncbi:hypothetical protein Tco_0789348 [Tanacetum coccineum]
MAGSGRIWPGQAGYGRSCRGLAEYGRVWPDMAGSDRLWPGLADYDRVWPVMTGYGRVWLVMTGYGRVLAGYGRVWPVMTGREGRAVSRRYTDDKDYGDRSEPSPRQGRDNRDYDIKRSRYESSRRTPGIAHLQIGGYLESSRRTPGIAHLQIGGYLVETMSDDNFVLEKGFSFFWVKDFPGK